MITVSILLLLIPSIIGLPRFQSLIPNGNRVPNPCRFPPTWNPVGHYNPEHHTLQKNPFGLDFRANGFKWNATLCRKDSDKDGMTNGEELGDPNCTWKQGDSQPPQPVGHPGICEPVGSSMCSYQHFRCDCLDKCHGLPGHA